MEEKIPTGIPGLDPLLAGGLLPKTSTVVIGSTGSGKTTFATQFIMKGLKDGQEGIFISLDEGKEYIIRDALNMGWKDILYFLEEEKLTFLNATGKNFRTFVKKELPDFASTWSGANIRIVVDSITPMLWAVPSRYEQRELIGGMFRWLRKMGAIIVTLEEHGGYKLSSPEMAVPLYMSDAIIHLKYSLLDDLPHRKLRIIKTRGTPHEEGSYEYRIIGGIGLVVMGTERGCEETNLLDELGKKLRRALKDASPLARERAEEILKHIHRCEIKDLDIDELVDIIKREVL